MPKKEINVDVVLKFTGDGPVLCDVPDRGVFEVAPGGTLSLPKKVADHYLSCGRWKKIKKEGGV